jgi:tRNA(fMet)-specific endonuclease VapC
MSAARYMLDTDICIYMTKRQPPGLLKRLQRLSPGQAVLSVITFGELEFGAAKSQAQERAREVLDELISLLPVLPLPADAAGHYGQIRAELETKGRPIGNNDLWIAAHARAEDLVLVTHNPGEFKRVPRLRVESWAR